MEFNLDDYERIGEKTRLLEFAQPNIDLIGCFIYDNKIEGSIGIAEITSIRKDPIILIRDSKMIGIEQNVSRATIIKSSKGKKNDKVSIEGENKNEENEQADEGKNEENSDWILYSESGEEKLVEETKKKIKKKKRVDMRKSLRKKLNLILKKTNE